MPYTDDDWLRLGKTLRERRHDLGIRTRPEFIEQRGWALSGRTLANLETGRPPNPGRSTQARYAPETIMAVEDAYGWRRGSVERVLRGEAPQVIEAVRDETQPDGVQVDERARLRALVDALHPRDFRRTWDFLAQVLAEQDERSSQG